MTLPHAFPCRIVPGPGGAGEGRAWVRWSADDWWLRGGAAVPIGLLVEAAAQASAALLAPGATLDAAGLRLAGVEDATVEELPRAGESWEVEARVEARLGSVTRVAARFLAGGRETGRATLVLAG